MGFLFNCGISHSAFHLFYKLGCMYAAPVWDSRLIAARVVPEHYLHSSSAALHPPKKSLWDPTMKSFFHRRRRAEVIDSLCASSRGGGKKIQHGSSSCGEGHVPQRSVTLQISSPPQSQPESPFSPPPPLRQIWFSSSRSPIPGERKQILL